MNTLLAAAKSWGLRLLTLAAVALILPACKRSSSSGAAPNPGFLIFSTASFSAAENGGPATITVQRSGGSLGPVSVAFSTANGSAASGSDYTTAAGTLTWLDGDAADKTFNVTITDDALVEGSETVLLTLSLPGGGATLGALAAAVLSITDDDAPPAGVLQFSAATYSVSESGGFVTITVTRTGGSAGVASVIYTSGNLTATAADYTAVPPASTLTWAALDSADKTFNVPILPDGAGEADETFSLTLSGNVGASLGTVVGAVVTILDDDAAGTIQLSSATYSVNESGTTADVILTRTNGSAGAVGVTIVSANGTAAAGSDYTAVPVATTVTWGAGDVAPKTFSVTLSNDATVEPNETFTLTISVPTGGAGLGGTVATTVSILNDDTTLQFSAAAPSISESGATAVISVTRLGSFAAPVSVQFASANGSALAGTDYTAAAGPLTWGAGDGATKTFNVTISSDAASEVDETVNLTLSNPVGIETSLGAQNTSVLTILDDDVTFVFSSAVYAVTEGAGPLVVTVTRTGAPSAAVSVDWTNPVGGTATAGGTDYTAAPSTLNFIAGDMSETFNVAITSDPAVETNETFNLALANPTIAAGTAVLGTPNTAVATITDDDINLSFVAATASVNENVATVTLTVRRSGLSAGAVSVQYSTANGSALSGTDYTAIGLTTLSWANNDVVDKTFNVTITNDNLVQGNLNFTASLSNFTGATVGAFGTSTVTITEDDAPGTLQFSAATYSVGEAGPTATVTVTRVGGVGNTVTAIVSTANNSAAAGSDYTALTVGTGLVTFPAGSAVSQIVTIPIINDGSVEAIETVDLSLGAITGSAALGAPGTATLTINDDDVTLQFTAAGFNVGENGGTVNATVSRVGRSTGAVSVSYGVTSGTAVVTTDFTFTGTLSWADGDTANKNVVVTGVNDAIIQGDLTAIFTLNTPTGGAGIGAQNATTVTILEDDAPGTLQFTAVNFNVNEGNVNAQVTLSRTGGTGGAVSVDVTFPGGGSATAGGTDFTVPGTVTVSWGAGVGGNQTFLIPIVADAANEGTETINLGLTNATGSATIGGVNTTTVSILDAAGSIQFTSATFSGGESSGNISVTMSRTGGSGGLVGVTWATSNGTAIAGSDYTTSGATLTWNDGETGNKSVNIPVTSDILGEGNETFSVALSLPTGSVAIGAQSSTTVTITDDDTQFIFSAATTSIPENGATVNITVQRIGVLTGTDTVQYSTLNGSALAGTDFVDPGTPTLTFVPSDASESFNITITDDVLAQGNLTFTVNLSNPSAGTTVGTPATITVTITEDDLPGTLAFSATTYTVNEDGVFATITVTRTGGTGGTATVTYNTNNGTANGADYMTTTNLLTFPAGDPTPQTFNVNITNDGTPEGNETVLLTLSGNTIAALGTSAATLTIRDNDATMVLSSATYSVNESGPNLVVTINRQNGTVGDVTVNLATGGGTATAGTDYTAVNQNVTFLSLTGTSQTVNIPITDDVVNDPGETFNLTLTFVSGSAVIGTPNTAVATITDNEGPDIASTLPISGATGVFLDTNLVITFAASMVKTSVESRLSITPGPVPYVAFWDTPGGNLNGTILTVVFDPVAPTGTITGNDLLSDGSTTYTWNISAGAQAAAGGPTMTAKSGTFQTIADGTPPAIVSITPDPRTATVTAPSSMVFVFNEPMSTSGGTAQTNLEGPGGDQRSASVGSPDPNMTVVWTNSTTLTITFSPALLAGSGYRLQIWSLNDAANNWQQDGPQFDIVTSKTSDGVAPTVIATHPPSGAVGVSRDSGIFISLKEPMSPSIKTKTTVTGGGVTAADYKINFESSSDGFNGVNITPLKAWPPSTTLTITLDGTATDTGGTAMGANFTSTFTTSAGSASAISLDEPYSSIKNNMVDVETFGLQGMVVFKYASGALAYIDASPTGLSLVDFSITEQATGLPIKGYYLRADDWDAGGRVEFNRSGQGLLGLKFSTAYTFTFKGTLKSSMGGTFAPTSYTFTTIPNAGNRRPSPGGGEVQSEQSPAGVQTYIQTWVNDDGPALVVTAQDDVDTGFNKILTPNGNGQYQYNSAGSESGFLPTVGDHTLTFTYNDGSGLAGHIVTLKERFYRFADADLTAQTLVSVSAGLTPTYTWSGTIPASATVLVVIVLDSGGNEIQQWLVPKATTSFVTPADMPLTAGTYSWALGYFHSGDGTIRDEGGFGMTNSVGFIR